jgi:hypothetical protein
VTCHATSAWSCSPCAGRACSRRCTPSPRPPGPASPSPLNARLRAQTEGAFACELAGLPAHHRQLIADTLALSTEWGTWYLLREELHLAPAQAGQRFRVLLNQLIEPADFAHIGTISSEEPV